MSRDERLSVPKNAVCFQTIVQAPLAARFRRSLTINVLSAGFGDCVLRRSTAISKSAFRLPTKEFIATCRVFLLEIIVRTISSMLGVASSAAADGVGARRSAVKSAMVVSVSCPHATYHRSGTCKDCARHLLLIKGHKVFKRTSASRQNVYIGVCDTLNQLKRPFQ